MGKYSLEELIRKVIGCCVRVHKALGPGFLESVYQQALAIEFEEQEIAFEAENEIELQYHDRDIGSHRLDMYVDGQLVVELKATDKLVGQYYAQVRSYLKATRTQTGLLVNFGAFRLDPRRVELR